ncbi:BTAD domain-containing putative transcriptional regulator [Streptomyces massasporeus]|uniref:BTAD domain-containing putative transcriptional regulator n=1 Tax=Streptomyces massasporeus TaxID=67324 RepID=UPI0038274352
MAPDEVDSHRFVELVKRGGQELGRNSAAAAAALLGEALDLRRDVPFADVPPTPAVEAEASRLTASHTQAQELRIEARVRLGHHEAVLDDLEALIAEHPLREAMRGQFMLALYRSGRQADALAAYRQLRHRLAEELGIEPGPSLQQLPQRILTADASLLGPKPGTEPEARAEPRAGPVPEPVAARGPADRAPETDPAPSGRARPDRTRQERAPAGRTETAAGIPTLVPRELPHVGSAFIGRAGESSVLRKVLDRAEDGHVAIAAIDGTGGVGKSALAIHTAHQVADRFPDGQFYVDLHGATAGLTPLEPGDVLGRFLSTLGLPQVAIPTKPDEAAATFRSMVADRRILVVLDNAAGVEQVRPLLPAGPGCAVLITSREMLTALEGATHLHLGVLFHDQAMGLLERLLGPERVAADAEAADAIIRMCGGLPLALRIVGARLAARPSWPLSAFVERLTDAQGRLDEIRVGDVSVRASFHASYHAIRHGDNPTDQAAARAFRLLGVVPGSSMSLPAASALLGVSTGPAEDALERLVNAHLLNSPAPARYQMHDLLRLFAREQVWAEEPEAERERALERVLRFYLAATQQAVAFLEVPPYFDRRAQDHLSAGMAGTPSLPTARIRDQLEAEAWLITERANLIATVLDSLTQSDSTARLAVRLTELLQWYLYPYARARELWTLGEAALRTARRLGDRESEAWALHNLSAAYWLHRQFDRMRQCLEAALVIWRETGDRDGERRSLHNLADALTEMQSYEESVALQTRQLGLAREAGDHTAQVTGLGDLGRAYRGLGRVEDALTCFEESFQHARKIGDSSLQSFALHEISALCFEQGRNQEAHEYLERAGILGGGHLTTYVGWRGHAWSAFFPAVSACGSARTPSDRRRCDGSRAEGVPDIGSHGPARATGLPPLYRWRTQSVRTAGFQNYRPRTRQVSWKS